MKTETLFSSVSMEWETPPDIFRELDAEFHFTLDAASTDENALCARHLTKEDDALHTEWNAEGGAIYVNPPYGRSVARWVEKAYKESLRGQTVVMLIPARTDTKWFHDMIYNKAEIRFLRGRLRFGMNGVKATINAPFPSMIVIYRGG